MPFVRGLMTFVASLCLGIGFGHAAIGRARRGFIWLGAFLAGLILTAVWFWSLAAAGAIYAAALIDAFVCGVRSTEDPRWLRWTTALATLTTIAFGLVVRISVLEGFKLPSSSMYPTLEIGDHVLVNKLASVERGQLAVFRYPCDPTRAYLKRVVALGGDTVEVRCSMLYVNGKAVPATLVAAETTYSDHDERDRTYFTRQASRYRETLGSVTYDIFQDADRPMREKSARTAGDSRDFPSRSVPFPPSCQMSDDQLAGTPSPKGRIVETKSEFVATACEPQLHYEVPARHLFVMGDNRSNSNDSRVWGALPVDDVKGRVIGIWWTNRDGTSSPARFGPID